MSSQSASTNRFDEFQDTLRSQKPFSLIHIDQFKQLISNSKLVKFPIGSTILQSDKISNRIYIVLSGNIRLLSQKVSTDEIITLDKRGPGQIIGWISLLRGDPTEWVSAAEETYCLSIDSKDFFEAYRLEDKFADFFNCQASIHEFYNVLCQAGAYISQLPSDWENTS